MRKAEMEVNKAQNMMDFEEEIMSRPPKVWFQTLKEKRTLAEAAKVSFGDPHGMEIERRW